jgi:hypothetical protein
MGHLVWLLVLVCFLVVLASLGSALFHLGRGTPEDSAKLARALTVRITLSLVLFVLLMLAWYFGLISPHGLQGATAPPHP